MDSYLEIARKVLVETRRPLSARQILKTAYRMQIVPADLYGRTQHKTLQARLSTEILHHKARTDFFRTGPGVFSLRSSDARRGVKLPQVREYAAPSRAAQLGRFEVLVFARSSLCKLSSAGRVHLRASDLRREPMAHSKLKDVLLDRRTVALRLMVLLLHEDSLLLRQKLAVESGSMPSHTSVGFEGVVKRDDKDLFSEDDFGLVEAASRTVAEWLSIPPIVLSRLRLLTAQREAPVLFEEGCEPMVDDLVVFLAFDCANVPEIIEATRDRARFDWQHLPVRLNNLDRFDRWSTRILEDLSLQTATVGRG